MDSFRMSEATHYGQKSTFEDCCRQYFNDHYQQKLYPQFAKPRVWGCCQGSNTYRLRMTLYVSCSTAHPFSLKIPGDRRGYVREPVGVGPVRAALKHRIVDQRLATDFIVHVGSPTLLVKVMGNSTSGRGVGAVLGLGAALGRATT